uniref:EF-hand domain-containing protein n=1 Tax=Strigamia maritima TaxID=126957 RepID=T1IXR3_STRMM
MKYELSIPHPLHTHTPVLEDSIKGILERLYQHYASHLIDVYDDFVSVDKAREGLIPFGQLLRILRVPNDFTEAEVKLLMHKFQAPEKPGYFDYVTFNNELEFVGRPEVVRFRDTHRFRSRTGILELPPPSIVTISVKNIIDRIMRTVYKHNIHLYDYLNIYDTSRAGIILEKQFAKGVWLAVGTEAGMTQDEINVLAQFFRNRDGYVPYREFCNVVDSAFVPLNLEKNDVGKMCQMNFGHRKDDLRNRLTEDEERCFQSIVKLIAREVDTRHLQMAPFFDDYENKAQYPGLVSATDFNRVLQKFDIDLSPGESQLLLRKYEVPSSGGIRYKSFLHDVDAGFQRFRVYFDKDVRLRDQRFLPGEPTYKCGAGQMEDVFTTLKKIRHHVMEKRIRVSEFFRDYDYTRTGSIPESQFVRGLDLMLVGAFSQDCRVSPDELGALLTHYRDPTKRENILWRRFEIDVDAVFVTRNLEKNPTIRPEPAEYVNPKVVHDPLPLWSTVNHASIALEKLRTKVRQQNIDLRSYFLDFDRCRVSRVSPSIFDRAISHFQFQLPEADLDALRVVYSDNRGFNYARFSDDLRPEQKEYDRHGALLAMLKARLAAQQTRHPGAYIDLLDLIFRLRGKMRKSRLILFEYLKQHDKHNRNILDKSNFRRALSLAGFELTDREYDLLENCFERADAPDHIDLILFYDTINSAVAVNELEKSPLSTPFLFENEPQIATNIIGPENDKLLWSAMHRMARQLRQRPVFMEPFFEDLDPRHTEVTPTEEREGKA